MTVITFLHLSILFSIASASPQCELCRRVFVKFNSAFNEVDIDGSLGGGNSDWEEKHIGQYAFSELHSMEVLEKTYKSLDEKAANFLSEIENDVEEFWASKLRSGLSTVQQMEDEFCVQRLHLCCPWNTFGSECKTCNSCTENRGNCDGNGTRAGSGECVCKSGYTGPSCAQCNALTHFQSETDSSVCTPCNPACSGGCTDDSAASCVKCADGYEVSETEGVTSCVDIDECSNQTAKCDPGTFCTNSEGSFSCAKCPKECSSCMSSSFCLSCAPGYSLEGGSCVDVDECNLPNACPGEHRKCVNRVGSYSCTCEQGYRPKDGKCVPVSPPKAKTRRRAPKKEKEIWTTAFKTEDAKFAGVLALFGLALYLSSQRTFLCLSIAVVAVAYVCYHGRTFDILFDKK